MLRIPVQPWTTIESRCPVSRPTNTVPGRRNPAATYIIAADPAEGDPNSDPSAATVIRKDTWEEVAHLHGQFEPTAFAGYLALLSTTYNHAEIIPERNNHGHAVIVALHELGAAIYRNPHDDKLGWLSNLKWKTLATDNAATAFKDGAITLHTQATYLELSRFSASTLESTRRRTRRPGHDRHHRPCGPPLAVQGRPGRQRADHTQTRQPDRWPGQPNRPTIKQRLS